MKECDNSKIHISSNIRKPSYATAPDCFTRSENTPKYKLTNKVNSLTSHTLNLTAYEVRCDGL